MCLFLEILHFNVKHYVAVDTFEAIRWLLALRYSLECNLHIFHLFLNGILSDGISILLINGISLVDCLRQLKPKFIDPFKVSSTAPFHNGDNSIPFLQDIMNPSVKCWFMLNAMCYGIFGNLDWG